MGRRGNSVRPLEEISKSNPQIQSSALKPGIAAPNQGEATANNIISATTGNVQTKLALVLTVNVVTCAAIIGIAVGVYLSIQGSSDNEESIQCNFEKISTCGYTIQPSVNAHWTRATGSLFSRPQFDKTFGTQKGHHMVVANRQDPKDYLCNGYYPKLMPVNNAVLISPLEEIHSESCLEFYYYLNGSAVRPNPLSAHLLVYIINDNQKTLLWYDCVNRTIDGWLKGWVPIQEGFVYVIF